MQPLSLSASSLLTYESCPARWKAEYLLKTPSPSGKAASMGTVCHGTLERWVAEGWYLQPLAPVDAWKELRVIYDDEHYKEFGDTQKLDEGFELCKKWYGRTDWRGRTVLSTEVKKSFDLTSKSGVTVPFNYVMDRVDRLDDGAIEVIDYKTSVLSLQPDDLRHKVQARCYALAAQIEHPDAPRIWVTFDMLRYERVGVVFTREDNVETWRYLKQAWERVLADSGEEERLNDMCRFCVRKFECDTLTKHTAGGGSLGVINDPAKAVDLRAQLAGQQSALKVMVEELDEYLKTWCEANDEHEFTTDRTHMKITARRNRYVDPPMVARVVDPAKLFRFTKLGVGVVDDLLKPGNPTLNAEEKTALAAQIRDGYGSPFVQTKPVKQ